jgi:hypothetical protein
MAFVEDSRALVEKPARARPGDAMRAIRGKQT